MKDLLLFVLGASIASFLGVVVDRFPEKSLFSPASHCEHCQTRLGLSELIPIFSQLYYGSRCKHCQVKISNRYWLMELFGGCLFLGFSWGQVSPAVVCLLLMSLTLALYDYDQMEYPVMVWLIFTLLLIPFAHSYKLFFLLCLVGFLAFLFPLKIGSGDLFYLASASLILTHSQLLWLIQIAAWLGIFYLIHQKQKKPIAFIPFLAISLLFVLFVQYLGLLL